MSSALVRCSACKGSGWQECRDCRGEGKLPRQDRSAQGSQPVWKECPTCAGRGEVPCTKCGGRGVKHKDVARVLPTRSSTRRRADILKPKRKRSFSFDALASFPKPRIQKKPPSTPTKQVIIRERAPLSSSQVDLMSCGIVSVLFVLLCIVLLFGFDRVLVASEAFFLFSAWAGLRGADAIGSHQGERLESFRQYMAICFGLSCGLLAAYLVLTTAEGRALTEWVTSQTLRIIGSLFATVLGLGILEAAWRKAVAWLAM